MIRKTIPAIAAVLLIAAIACGSDDASSSPTQPPAATPEPTEEARTIFDSLAQYPSFNDEESGFTVTLGTPDLAVGRNRVAFVMSDTNVGIVKFPFARIETFAPGNPDTPAETVNAQFYDFPLKVRGLYVAELNLDQVGEWEINATIPDNNGNRVGIRFPVEVAAESESVALGAHVPSTDNRTLDDVESAFELTTSGTPDESLYDANINDLLDAGRPFVITFASPAFCTNALCGPQVEVLGALEEKYSDTAEFIHIDLYENPHEIKGDLTRAQRTSILDDWGLHTDEWTFVIDADGNVAAKFEAFVAEEELEQAIVANLLQG